MLQFCPDQTPGLSPGPFSNLFPTICAGASEILCDESPPAPGIPWTRPPNSSLLSLSSQQQACSLHKAACSYHGALCLQNQLSGRGIPRCLYGFVLSFYHGYAQMSSYHKTQSLIHASFPIPFSALLFSTAHITICCTIYTFIVYCLPPFASMYCFIHCCIILALRTWYSWPIVDAHSILLNE